MFPQSPKGFEYSLNPTGFRSTDLSSIPEAERKRFAVKHEECAPRQQETAHSARYSREVSGRTSQKQMGMTSAQRRRHGQFGGKCIFVGEGKVTQGDSNGVEGGTEPGLAFAGILGEK